MASESVEVWLREYEGYRGLVVLTDETAQRSRVITLWATPEAEEKATEEKPAESEPEPAAVAVSETPEAGAEPAPEGGEETR